MEAKNCQGCGAPLENERCDFCGRNHGSNEQVQGGSNSNRPSSGKIVETVVVPNQGNVAGSRPKNKVAALLLCFFLGWMGAHKFYEGKVGMGIVYLFTFGLFGFGFFIDFFILLFKPNPYYV